MNNNYLKTKEYVGYTPLHETPKETYENLGLISGLEVHQQLKTKKKLFCHCIAGRFHKDDDFQGEIIRHMRPTLSEMGGYDGTALMEFKTKKTIIYRINNETTCTYEIDDTPPFKINEEALNIAIKIAHLLKSNIVGELHITRKQYLDGSIPAGFQRTAIVGVQGNIPLKHKNIRIIQLSIEEDACREVSDIGHVRIYKTDRLGMPLIETVTYPDMKTPQEVAEAAEYIRFLGRSTGNVRTGIGAGREDVNVSITGGTRIEIKGVDRIASIPELVHNEAFRQKSLLEIKKELLNRVSNKDNWKIKHIILNDEDIKECYSTQLNYNKDYKIVAVNLPQFKNILSFFTQPERMFSDEISDRLKVIACIEKPNMTHSEDRIENCEHIDFNYIRSILNSNENDAQIVFWGPESDIDTALETIEERCKMAFEGIPNETRKKTKNGISIFERVLPGADRMYPDTDSAPISITEENINELRKNLPLDISERYKQLKDWNVPEDTYFYLLRNNLIPLIERISKDFNIKPSTVAILLGHRLKNLQGKDPYGFINANYAPPFNYERIYELFDFINKKGLQYDIIFPMLKVLYTNRNMDMDSILNMVNYKTVPREKILSMIPTLSIEFDKINNSSYIPPCII